MFGVLPPQLDYPGNMARNHAQESCRKLHFAFNDSLKYMFSRVQPLFLVFKQFLHSSPSLIFVERLIHNVHDTYCQIITKMLYVLHNHVYIYIYLIYIYIFNIYIYINIYIYNMVMAGSGCKAWPPVRLVTNG